MVRKLADLRGAKQIANEFGVSDRTIHRWHKEGRLEGVKKLGGRTSPLRMTRNEAARLRGSDD